MKGRNGKRGGKKGYPPSTGVAFIKEGLKGKKGRFDAINIVLKVDMLDELEPNEKGEIRLKGFINEDQDDDSKKYAFLSEDDYEPEAKKASGSKRGGRRRDEEDTDEDEDSEEFPL